MFSSKEKNPTKLFFISQNNKMLELVNEEGHSTLVESDFLIENKILL